MNNQQLADAIAAEAHDTLAHSLSLMALNASALQAQSLKLQESAAQLGSNANTDDFVEQIDSISRRTQDIRKQAAGALDEAHSVIDMLRHPEQARLHLANADDTSLTRDSLGTLLADARSAGMQINAWIDIQQLGELNDAISTIAYRAVQEGLTNARRHAPNEEVSVEVTANPQHGVNVHISNPVGNTRPSPTDARPGAGLAGLLARVQKAHGTCDYGLDERRTFHLVVRLPWVR